MKTQTELYYIRIGKEVEHRTHWSGYSEQGDYQLSEAQSHAREAKNRLSTGRRKVTIERETCIVEILETL